MIKALNKTFIILLILSIPFTLTGCWDYLDIEQRNIIISVGIDKSYNKLEFSSEIASFVSSMSQRSDRAELGTIHTDISYADTFEEIRLNGDRKRPYPTFLGATRTVVFGRNYAEYGISSYLNRINMLPDYRKTILPVVSRESPKELFKINIPNDLSVGFLIEHMISTLDEAGEALYPTVGQIISYISIGEVGYFLPYIGISNGEIKFLGYAAMNKNSQLLGILSDNNAKGVLYIWSKKPMLPEVITNDKNSLVSFSTVDFKRNIKTNYVNDKVIINFNFELKENIQYQYELSSIKKEDLKKFELIISNRIKSYVSNVVKVAQEDYKCDIFQLSRYFRAQNPKIYNQINGQKNFLKLK